MSFAEPPTLALFASRYRFEFFADPRRAAYEAFGFRRASLRRVWLDPRVWLRYARLLGRLGLPGAPVQDTLQLGGDVVAGADGIVRWVYASTGPEDRPSVQEIGSRA